MNTLPLWKRAALVMGILLAIEATAFGVNTVTTVPVGYLKIDITAGTVVAPVSTSFSIPLTGDPLNTGAVAGRLTGVTASKLKVTGAGWTDGALAVKAFPYAVRFTSGANAGLTLVITANTTAQVTVSSSVDLTTIGIKTGSTSGDTVQIIPVDTLNSLFGADTLIGADTPAAADKVYLGANDPNAYYYNTTLSRWVRTTGATTDRGNVQILPQAMLRVVRVGAATSLIFPGRVPETNFVNDIANSGTTYSSAGFPTDTTLGALALQTKIPGWVSSTMPATADTVSIRTATTLRTYFYNGTRWLRTTDSVTANRDGLVLPAGTPFYVTRLGAATGTSRLTVTRPYALQ